MKAILISIQPKYVADILNGKKTLEIRKTIPQEYLDYCIDSDKKVPIDVYIYCTKDKGSHYNSRILRRYGDTFMIDKVDYKTLNPALNGKVVAKFTLNKVEELCPVIRLATNKVVLYRGKPNGIDNKPLLKQSCLTNEELNAYLQLGGGYAWHIDNLVVFDKPMELSNFKPHYVYPTNHRLTRAPQSWCYVEM